MVDFCGTSPNFKTRFWIGHTAVSGAALACQAIERDAASGDTVGASAPATDCSQPVSPDRMLPVHAFGTPTVLEQWHSLTLEPGPRPVLVLDTSESAKAFWPVMRSLTEGVLEIMPADTWPRIYFLGNPAPHDAADFAANAERWFDANRDRGSLLSPVFETLETETDIAVVVVGNGVIFDLPDWQGHPLAERAIWCRYGPAELTGGAYKEESYTVEQMAEKLHNPALRIEIAGPGVMPFYWDDAGFRWENGKLVGEKTSGTLTFGLLAPESELAQACVVLSNGVKRILPLTPADPIRLPEFRNLPGKEDNLLRQCLRQGKFRCPNCNHDHPAGQWRCPESATPPVFRMLEEMGKNGFVLVNTEPWQGQARPHPCRALRLQNDVIAVRLPDGGAALVHYDSRSNSWKTSNEKFSPMHPVMNKIYALVV